MSNTPAYGWPYQALFDAPHGPNLGHDLALAVESTVLALATRVTAVENAQGTSYRARITVGASIPSVTFSGIPTTLRRLTARWSARSDDAGFGAQEFRFRVNGDVTAASYHYEFLQGATTGLTAVGQDGTTAYASVGLLASASAASGVFGHGSIDFQSWDSPHTGYLGFTFNSGVIVPSLNLWTIHGSGHFVPAGPYTSLTFLAPAGNLVAGSDFQLEGVG